jgi:hypothetical protein
MKTTISKNMKEFTKIIPKKGYENWLDKLGKMGELVSQTEVQTVVDNLRKAAILSAHVSRLYSLIDEFNRDGLVVTPLTRAESGRGFSTLATPTKDPNADWIVCLTRSYEDGQKFKSAYFKNDHKTIGEMLGYPDCCIKYFIKSFPVDHVPIWLGLSGRIKGYPEANGMLRYFGPKLTSHFSCSPLCEKTKEIGEIWFEEMNKINGELSQEMRDLLSGPIVWNSYHGVVQIDTPYFVGLNSSLCLLNKPRIIHWKGK